MSDFFDDLQGQLEADIKNLSLEERQVDALERIAEALESIAAQSGSTGRGERDQPTQKLSEREREVS